MSEVLLRVGTRTNEETMMTDPHPPWAQVLSLGDARFGILVGGPFDGRCYPLFDGTPDALDVPGPEGPGQPALLRYVLRDGLYRFAGVGEPALPAA
jgi:hypothetical protein